jgi:hypothetical protein
MEAVSAALMGPDLIKPPEFAFSLVNYEPPTRFFYLVFLNFEIAS